MTVDSIETFSASSGYGDKNDPFIELSLGNQTRRTETIYNTGGKAVFKTQITFAKGDDDKLLHLRVYDDSSISDVLLGETLIDLNTVDLMSDGKGSLPLGRKTTLTIEENDGSTGQVTLTFDKFERFLPPREGGEDEWDVIEEEEMGKTVLVRNEEEWQACWEIALKEDDNELELDVVELAAPDFVPETPEEWIQTHPAYQNTSRAHDDGHEPRTGPLNVNTVTVSEGSGSGLTCEWTDDENDDGDDGPGRSPEIAMSGRHAGMGDTRGKATIDIVNEDSSANIPSTEDANTPVIQIHDPLVLRNQTSQKHSVVHE